MTNPEDILLKASSQFVIDILKDSASGLKEWLKGEAEERDILKIAARKYTKHLIQHLNIIRVLGMEKPSTLENLYVNAFLHDETIETFSATRDELMNNYSSNTRMNVSERKRLSTENIINSFDKIVILGNPGSGKTTFLKSIALLNLKKEAIVKKRRIPIFISLRDYSQSSLDMEQFLVHQFNLHLSDDSEKLIKRLLLKGKCQILLDGLDEISSSKQAQVITEINDFSTKFKDNQIVVSCRIGAYYNWFTHFCNLEIAHFDQSQIEEFSKKWFTDKETNKDFLTKLKENDAINELASNPLLLSMICLSYKARNTFPENKAKLYKSAIEVLMEKWDKQKQVKRDEFNKELTSKDIISVISDVGHGTFKRGELFLPRRTLSRYIEEGIMKLKKVPAQHINGSKMLTSIEVNQGIFSKMSSDIYSFSHLTFQEYFAAKYIESVMDIDEIKRFLDDHLYKDKWREVIAIISGLLPVGDEYISYFRKRIKKLASQDKKVIKLLKLAEKINLLDSPNILERLISIYIALKLIVSQSRKYQSILRSVKLLIRSFQYSHNLSIAENFNKNYYSLYKKPLDNYADLIISIRNELDLAGDVVHKMLYPYQFEMVYSEIEEFVKFSYMKDSDFESNGKSYFDTISIYYDCLSSEPYLTLNNIENLKNEIYKSDCL